MFEDERDEDSKYVSGNTEGDDDYQALNDENPHVKRRRIARCGNDECLDMKDALKNQVEVLGEQVKRKRGSVKVCAKLNKSLWKVSVSPLLIWIKPIVEFRYCGQK